MVRARPQMSFAREVGLAHETGGAAAQLAHFAGLGESPGAALNHELTQSRFAAYAILTGDAGALGALREGEWGFAKLARVDEKALFTWLWEKISLYVQDRLERARR